MFLSLSLSLSLFGLSSASATTLSVGPTQPYGTIQTALDAAVPGDVVEVDGGVYSGPITVTSGVSVIGMAGSAGTWIVSVTAEPAITLSGDATLSGFDVFGMLDVALDVQGGVVASVEDIRIAGMNVGEAAVRVGEAASLVLTHAQFDDNENAFGLGGHLYVDELATVDVHQGSFVSGLAARGGAIFAEPSAVVSVHDTLFESNSAVQGGHLAGVWGCFDSVFRDGISTNVGGAGQDSCLSAAHSVFESNVSGADGGALYFTGGRGIDIVEVAFVSNTAGGNGGAIRMGNDLNPNPSIQSSYFCENSASGLGGGVYSHFWSDVTGDLTLGTLTVANTIFAANAPSAITHSSQNHDGSSGAPVDATYNTFIDNPAGGLDQFLSELPVVVGNIFVGHGAAYTDASPYRFDNGMQHDNLWFANVNDAVSDYLPSATAVFEDPELNAWSDDGDCWNDDFQLLPGSPAVDAGGPGDIDPDGSPADIGAYGGPNAPTEAIGDRFDDLDPGPDPSIPDAGVPDPGDVGDDGVDPVDPVDDGGDDLEDGNGPGDAPGDEGDPAPDEGDPAPDEGDPAPDEGDPAPDEGDPAPDEGDPAPDEGDPAPDDDPDAPDLSDDDADDAGDGELEPDPGSDPSAPQLPSVAGQFERVDPCPGTGEIDSDGDGVFSCTDCDDNDPTVQECAGDGSVVSRHAALDGGGGCGCSSTPTPYAGWLLIPLLFLRRRA
jgi:predicted outer membrane repeat protein